jgi:hypothetical protein
MKRFLLILTLRKTIVLNPEKEDAEFWDIFYPCITSWIFHLFG